MSNELREVVARAMVLASGKDPDKLTPAPRGSIGNAPLWHSYRHLADAATAAMQAHSERGDHIKDTNNDK